jgi:hypothetical protein
MKEERGERREGRGDDEKMNEKQENKENLLQKHEGEREIKEERR